MINQFIIDSIWDLYLQKFKCKQNETYFVIIYLIPLVSVEFIYRQDKPNDTMVTINFYS